MLRALLLVSALCLCFSASASPAEPSAADAAAVAGAAAADDVPTLDDGVCDPSDVECALSLRQLRAAVRSPSGNSPPQAGAEESENGPLDDSNVQRRTSLAETLHEKKNVKTLYHLTSPHICGLIKKNGFKPGRNGWCGGAIYFAASYHSVWSKAVGINSHTGCLLKVKVDVGKTKEMPPTCDLQMTRAKLAATKYDSIRFNPGDGIEYVIFDPKRVLSVEQIWHDPKLGKDANGLAPVRVDENGKPIKPTQFAEEGAVGEESPAEAEAERSD